MQGKHDTKDFATERAMAPMHEISENRQAKEWDACLKTCADCHYETCGRSETTAQFVGDLDGFVRFLDEKFGFAIKVNHEKGKILYDINRNFCICPTAKHPDGEIPDSLRECSRVFCERMFSEVLQRPVHAKLLRSWLRNGKSCTYEITMDSI